MGSNVSSTHVLKQHATQTIQRGSSLNQYFREYQHSSPMLVPAALLAKRRKFNILICSQDAPPLPDNFLMGWSHSGPPRQETG